jgi:hypothetical protein
VLLEVCLKRKEVKPKRWKFEVIQGSSKEEIQKGGLKNERQENEQIFLSNGNRSVFSFNFSRAGG